MSAGVAPHVLVVDDEADVRDLVLEYLSKNEMRVSAAASTGAQGTARYFASAQP